MRPPALKVPDEQKYGRSYSLEAMDILVGLAELHGAVFVWDVNRFRQDGEWYWYTEGIATGNKHIVYVAERYLHKCGLVSLAKEVYEKYPHK